MSFDQTSLLSLVVPRAGQAGAAGGGPGADACAYTQDPFKFTPPLHSLHEELRRQALQTSVLLQDQSAHSNQNDVADLSQQRSRNERDVVLVAA